MKSTLILTLLMLATAAYAQNPLTLVGVYDAEVPESYFGGGLTFGDFNADGYEEFIIGAWGWNNNTGKNYIYQGGPVFPVAPTWTIQGTQENEGYDWSDKYIGDVNGDGIDDFAIPTLTNGTSVDTAHLDVYFGAIPLDTVPDLTYYSPYLNTPNNWDVDSCGDVNGDGGKDFVVEHWAYGDPEIDQLQIFFGGVLLDNIPDWTCNVEHNYIAKGVGDLNGDGFSDIMSVGYNDSVLVYFGGSPMDTLPDLVFDEGYVKFSIGTGVRDVNNDGYCDLAFCWKPGDSLLAYDVVHYGGPDMDTEPDMILHEWSGDTSVSLAGMSCGDFNGDGIGDIIAVSSYGYYLHTVQIFLGSDNFNPTPDAFISASLLFDWGEYQAAGDVDGDGRDELLISEINYMWFYTGRVYLYDGPEVWVDYGAQAVGDPQLSALPEDFRLEQNYPNPFNRATTIFFELSKPGIVNLTVYDLQGQVVRELIQDQWTPPGRYPARWAGTDKLDHPTASGIYLLELNVNQYKQTIKMALLR